MGVRKHKWSLEEEAALRAGIAKHGLGKWSTIIRDTEFASILHLRSNVDLKDKWRNMSLMASGARSCQRVGSTNSKTEPSNKLEIVSFDPKEEYDMNITSSVPKTILAAPLLLKSGSSKMTMPSLDSLILHTIANLKESYGSSRAAIAKYIEENHSTPSNLDKLLKAELNSLLDCGKLKKLRHRYRITQSFPSRGFEKNPTLLLLEAKQEYCPSATKILTKAEIDEELEKMLSMTPQQAAAIAMKAVAEAEAAIKEAEMAAREAEAAEADAELAKVFAAAAMRELKQTALYT